MIQLIALNIMAFCWLLIGAGIGLWAYYRGVSRQNPLPQVRNPLAGLLHKNGEDEPKTEEPAQSLRRA